MTALAGLRPKRPDWFRGFLVVAVVSMMVYLAAAWWAPWTPGRLGGLTFGTLAALLFVVDALYPFRRRWNAWPFGNVQRWLQFHVYGGAIAGLYVLLHVGFRLPNGLFGWWLFLLSLWVIGSGLAGVYLQKRIPTVLANNLAVEAIYERIPELTARLQAEADKLLAGAPDLLQRFYSTNTRASLATVAPAWGYLVDFRAERERRMAPFKEVVTYLSDVDRMKLGDLQAIVTEKFELDVQYSLQRILKVWVPLHAVPAVVLMGLLVVHVAAALLF
jgi:hypothetical protein